MDQRIYRPRSGRHGESWQDGPKEARHYHVNVGPGACQVVRLRLTASTPADLAQSSGDTSNPFGRSFDQMMKARCKEADEFYAIVIPPNVSAD
jgi:hypothetical protein